MHGEIYNLDVSAFLTLFQNILTIHPTQYPTSNKEIIKYLSDFLSIYLQIRIVPFWLIIPTHRCNVNQSYGHLSSVIYKNQYAVISKILMMKLNKSLVVR